MQVAVITGAGSGIGLACATKLAQAGMAIVGVGREAAKLQAMKSAVGDDALVAAVPIDVTADDAPSRIVDTAIQQFGRIDFLINNAGIGRPKPLHETSDEMLDTFLGLMLRAPFRLSREVLPHMSCGSAIINVSSTYAVVGGINGGAYSAAKAGLTGLTTHIAAQYGALGIRSNAVAPGVIPTPMTEGRFENDRFQKMNNHMTPYPRLGSVADVASTIAFLCSPDGEFINGQVIVVDGGWSSTKYLSEAALSATWPSLDN